MTERAVPAGRTRWQRRVLAPGVIAAAVLTPLLPATAANAASLCAPPADTVPPQITALSFSRSSVDLSSGSRRVTVTATATDTSGNGAGSGVQHIQLFLNGPTGYAASRLTRTAGSADNGTWTGTFTIPKRGRAGVWHLNEVNVVDRSGNYQDYEGYGKRPEGPTAVQLQPGWDTSLTVTGSGPPPPTKVKAGVLTGFTIAPGTVDAKHAEKQVAVTATFSSPRPRQVDVFFQGQAPGRHFFDSRVRMHHTTSGRWVGHLMVRRWVGDLTAHPQLYAEYAGTDSPGFRGYGPQTLAARHFSSKLTIVSRTDNSKPVLRALTFTPSSVDTTGGAEQVTVTAKATDTGSGVGEVRANLSINNGGGGSASGLYPYPGVGYGNSDEVGVSLKHVGSQWVGTARFRECVPSGSWRVDVFVSDRSGNGADYGWKRLEASQLPGRLSVASTPGDVEPPYVRGATSSGQDHSITLDFSEGVKNVTPATLSVFAMAPAASRFEQTSTISGIVCSNGSADVDCSGSGGLVTSAVLTVPSVTAGAQFQVYGNLNAITSQLTDGAGNPLDWSQDAANVTGS